MKFTLRTTSRTVRIYEIEAETREQAKEDLRVAVYDMVDLPNVKFIDVDEDEEEVEPG